MVKWMTDCRAIVESPAVSIDASCCISNVGEEEEEKKVEDLLSRARC
jgi:hypothetical protein